MWSCSATHDEHEGTKQMQIKTLGYYCRVNIRNKIGSVKEKSTKDQKKQENRNAAGKGEVRIRKGHLTAGGCNFLNRNVRVHGGGTRRINITGG